MTTVQASTTDYIENRTFDEIAIGDSASLVRTLRQEDIQMYAIMSGDINPSHVHQPAHTRDGAGAGDALWQLDMNLAKRRFVAMQDGHEVDHCVVPRHHRCQRSVVVHIHFDGLQGSGK